MLPQIDQPFIMFYKFSSSATIVAYRSQCFVVRLEELYIQSKVEQSGISLDSNNLELAKQHIFYIPLSIFIMAEQHLPIRSQVGLSKYDYIIFFPYHNVIISYQGLKPLYLFNLYS